MHKIFFKWVDSLSKMTASKILLAFAMLLLSQYLECRHHVLHSNAINIKSDLDDIQAENIIDFKTRGKTKTEVTVIVTKNHGDNIEEQDLLEISSSFLVKKAIAVILVLAVTIVPKLIELFLVNLAYALFL